MSKPFLFIACTHGDEPIGKEAVDQLRSYGTLVGEFDSVIGNPRALAENRRFVDVDLNRSAPGKFFSHDYEMRRARSLVRNVRRYPFVVDLHQTHANDRIVVIVTRVTRENLAFALQFPIDTFLLWPPPDEMARFGPIVSSVPIGIEIEAGTKTDFASTQERLVGVLQQFLTSHRDLRPESLVFDELLLESRFVYLVGEKIQEADLTDEQLVDFQEYQGRSGTFVPLLFGKHAGILGYKMRRIDKTTVRGLLSS